MTSFFLSSPPISLALSLLLLPPPPGELSLSVGVEVRAVQMLGVVLTQEPLQAAGGKVPEGLPLDTIRVPSTPLEAASLAFVGTLHSGGDGLGEILASSGIRLQLDGTAHTGLSSRQALASLRDFLRGFQESEAYVTRAAPVAGSGERGFAEITWTARIAGTSQEIRRTLFLGFYREQGEWRVDEVRLMR